MNSGTRIFMWVVFTVAGLLPFSAAWADIQAVETKLTADDAAESDRFGNAVAVSGNYAVVGAQFDGQYLISGFFYAAPGAAYVFKLENGVWTQQQKLTDPGSPTGYFGRSVAISGEYIIIGASRAAYIYKLEGGTWTQQTKITPPDGPDGSEFGYPLAMSGEYTVIGAPKTPSQTDDEDAVYIFKREGDTWTQQQKLISSDSSGQSAFGDSFALSGETIALAEYTENTDGSQSIYAIVFKRQNGVWTEQATLPVSDTADDIIHPLSLALSGAYMFAGDSTDEDLGNRSGAVYVFKQENGIWTKEAKLTAPDGAAQDFFGASVSADGDLLIVGKPSNNAYIYKRENGTWNEKNELYPGQDATALGAPVAVSGNYALVGASNDAENGYGSGAGGK